MSHRRGTPDPGQDPGSAEHDRLWRVLAAVMREADPVPPEILQSGRDSLAWRTIDAELAALTYDSAAEPPAAAVVRASEGPRLLRTSRSRSRSPHWVRDDG